MVRIWESSAVSGSRNYFGKGYEKRLREYLGNSEGNQPRLGPWRPPNGTSRRKGIEGPEGGVPVKCLPQSSEL